MTKIIDFHVHAFAEKIAEKAADNLRNYYNLELAGDGKFSTIYERAKKAGVEKMVIHAVATKPSQVEAINDYISGMVKSDPDRLIGFGAMHRDYDEYDKEIERIRSLGLSGIKLHTDFQGFKADDDKMFKIYEKFAAAGLPVLFHVGDRNIDNSSPKRIARVIDKVPQLKVVAAHMGGVFSWDEAEEYLVGKNLYFDTSSSLFLLTPERFLKMANAHGFDKLLFGTDYPISDYDREFAYFENINLTPEQKQMIFYDNACRFLNL